MNDDDLKFFQKQMSDVKRLNANRVNLSKNKVRVLDEETKSDTEKKMTTNYFSAFSSEDNFNQLDPREILSFKQKNLDSKIFKKLRQGKLYFQSIIDLHNMSVRQAKIELFNFIEECLDEGFSVALVIHGRGEGRERPALLKSWTNSWLKEIKTVSAFHSAQPQHGGTGATYILLNNYKKC
jgi:DNA-nicking Smr family endonuclease